MTIVGGGMEMIGFGLIVLQLVRAQRQEFGWPQLILRSRDRIVATVRRLLRRPRLVSIHAVDAAASFDMAGSLSVRKGMGQTAPDRFAAIEFNLLEIEKELRERIKELDQGITKVRDELNTTRSAIEQREREQEQERKAELRSSIKFEALGVVFFLSGTVLSVIGSV
jgi:hypothetical protein